MIPLDSELLNDPDRILTELVEIKRRTTELKTLEYVLKTELEQHLSDGKIKGIYKSNGITANRLQTKQKYSFSPQLTDLENQYKKDIEEKQELEILDNQASKIPTTNYWRITQDR